MNWREARLLARNKNNCAVNNLWCLMYNEAFNGKFNKMVNNELGSINNCFVFYVFFYYMERNWTNVSPDLNRQYVREKLLNVCEARFELLSEYVFKFVCCVKQI